MGIVNILLFRAWPCCNVMRTQQEIKVANLHALYFSTERLLMDENNEIIWCTGKVIRSMNKITAGQRMWMMREQELQF